MIRWGDDPEKDTFAGEYGSRSTVLHGSSGPAVPLDEALHKLEQRAREVLGDDIFMLFCNAANEDAIAVGTDVFNAARVGGDVFGWFEFIDFAIDRLFYFCWMYNTMFYCDCDNIVLRPEYCTLPQVRSRLSGRTKCVGREPCVLTFFIPSGVEVTGSTDGFWQQEGEIGTLTLLTENNSSADWSVDYRNL